MPWRVGLDEAGYGPNPVAGAVVVGLPSRPAPQCLWECWPPSARPTRDDGRLLIDDSKKVNEGKAGLARLEAGVLGALAQTRESFATVLDYLSAVALGDSLDDLHAEPWFHPGDPLPAAHPADALPAIATVLSDACGLAGVTWGPVRSVVIPAPKFNRLLDEWKVKSGVVAFGVIALLRATLELPGDEPIHITVDKLGGRHFYAPLLNEAFPGGWVRVIRGRVV